ncbi:hypothetical protein UTI89UKE3_057 [Escherichia phage vB_EcoP-UTI89UKE3]|uniref:Uncharacterized protein n=1 Tax=Escherichia phage vB_EcoP-UTI89UKE2 TaxID=2865826 RepID=A0AAE7XUB1_9CAUD|nr:hypothetical protein UTI89UKE2_057 [Escherichia phage vB_EcoP-UTI89UKE2]QZI84658.1 hypothetical protein UTI89UKE3_057 [Escherichia phage vB_EcoP-UTI89UKE3]
MLTRPSQCNTIHRVGSTEVLSSQLVRHTKRLALTLLFNNLLSVTYVCRG